MEKVEQFIQVNTKTLSNNIIIKGRECTFVEYKPWLTPDDARRVAEIAREETINEVCEYLSKNYLIKTIEPLRWVSIDKVFDDLKKYLEGKS